MDKTKAEELANNLRGSLIDTLDDTSMRELIRLSPAEVVDYAAYVIRLQDEDVHQLARRLDEAGVTQEALDVFEASNDHTLEDKMWDIASRYFHGG